MRTNIASLFTEFKATVVNEASNLKSEAASIKRQINRRNRSRSAGHPQDENKCPRSVSVGRSAAPTSHSGDYTRMWREHESEWQSFSASPPVVVSYSSIPFPPCDTDVLEFIEMHYSLQANPKMAYLVACRRYHPDKFLQQFGHLLPAADSTRIISRLNAITQCVTSEWKSRQQLKRKRFLSVPPPP